MALGVELENVYDSTTLDLAGVNVEDYLRVDEDWVPVAYEEGGASVQETIQMLAVGTAAQVKAALDELDKYLEIARLWGTDKSRRKWIKMSLLEQVGGFEAYRTIIGGRIKPASIVGNATFLDEGTGSNKYRFDLELDVIPGWEVHDTAASETTTFIDRYGGQDTLSNPEGTRPAQIEYFTNADDMVLFGDLWVGIRDEREGLTDFQALLPLTGGSGYNGFGGENAKTSTEYGGWYDGSIVATNDMLERVGWGMNNLSPAPTSWEDYHGRYLVLIRAKLDDNTAGEKVRLQLHWGFGAENETLNPPVVLSTDGTWTIVPLGYIVMPPWPNWWSSITHNMRNFTFRIFGGGLVGSALVSLDAMCLIPADHMFTMETSIDHVFRKVHAWTRRDWHAFAYGKDSTAYPKSGFPHHFQNWSLPTGSSEIVIALTQWSSGEKISPSPGISTMRWNVQRISKAGFPFVT